MSLREVLRTYRTERAPIAVIVVLLVLGSILETIPLVLIIPIAVSVTNSSDAVNTDFGGIEVTASASQMVVAAIVSVVAALAVRLVTAVAQARLITTVEERQRVRLYQAFLDTSWEIQSAEPPGRFQWLGGQAAAYAGLLQTMLGSLRYIINIVTMMIAAFVVSPLGASAIILVGAVIFAGLWPLLSAARRANRRAVEAAQVQEQTVAEAVSLSGLIKAFAVKDWFAERLRATTHTTLEHKRVASVLGGISSPVFQSAALLVALGILAVATTRQLDVPALGAVALLLIRTLSSAQGIQSTLHNYAKYRPSLDRLEEYVGRYASNKDVVGEAEVGAIELIEVNDVSYRYPTSDEPALRSIDLTLRAGDHVGLVGPSGAGKTTLAQLLMRLRRPTSGAIRVNGVRLDDVSPTTFAHRIAYVPQGPLVLRGTVHDNITLHRESLTRSQVEDAAHRAGIHQWIERLPQGYDTVVGPDSHGFSGGQAQRLSIARALVGDPSLLVLDEPTSALDVDSEELVTTTLRALPAHVIVVLIAHRMSTIKHCTRVVIVEDGEASVVGTAQEALDGNEFFRRAVQSGAFASP